MVVRHVAADADAALRVLKTYKILGFISSGSSTPFVATIISRLLHLLKRRKDMIAKAMVLDLADAVQVPTDEYTKPSSYLHPKSSRSHNSD